MKLDRTTISPVLILFAAFCFGTMAFLVKVSSFRVPIWEVTFFRFASVAAAIVCLYAAKLIRLTFVNKRLLLLRGILGGWAIVLYFFAISRIPVGTATLLNYSFPIFATLFSIIILREIPGLKTAVLLAFSLFGVALVSYPLEHQFRWGALVGIVSAVLAGAVMVTIRELRKTDNSWSILLSLSVCGSFFALPFLVAGGIERPSLETLGLLTLMSLFSMVAQLLFTFAMKYTRVAEGAILVMSTVAFSNLYGVLVFKDRLPLALIVGGAIIFLCGSLLIAGYPPKEPAENSGGPAG
jgi:drug/metabolite transporter (DMT)-like permease